MKRKYLIIAIICLSLIIPTFISSCTTDDPWPESLYVETLYVWDGAAWHHITANGSGGDVVGPAGATDEGIARYDGATGKLLQDSTAEIDDAGNLTVDGDISNVAAGDDIHSGNDLSCVNDIDVGDDANIGGNLDVTGTASISALPVHANNAAAVAGGLAAGDLYRTGGDPDLVCVVH